jgi:hypothetical protein
MAFTILVLKWTSNSGEKPANIPARVDIMGVSHQHRIDFNHQNSARHRGKYERKGI